MTRLRMLSGINQPANPLIEELKADRAAAIAGYDKLIKDVEQGKQLDEGLFTSLKATLATVGQLGAAGAKKATDAVKKIAANVKEIYLDNKAKAELELLVKNIKKVITDFEGIEKDASTIIDRDPEVKQEMQLFSTLLSKLLGTLSTRLMLSKGEGSKADTRDLGTK